MKEAFGNRQAVALVFFLEEVAILLGFL